LTLGKTAKPPWTQHHRVVAARRRWVAIDVVVRTIDNVRRHRTGRNAALVAHYGFLSVFPLMLVFTTVLGFVLESHPHLRQTIINSAFNRIPIIGQQIASDPSRITGSTVVLVLGTLTTLWAGMRAFNVLQSALDDVAEVPLDERPTVLHTRVRSLLGIAVVGTGQVGAAVLAGFVGVTGVAAIHKVILLAAAVLVNTAVVAATYRWLCSTPRTWRTVMPGAIVAGTAFAALQVTGTAVVARAIAKASPVYGTFAGVIGLLSWLSLHSVVALVGAELNEVLPARRVNR
jgi:YihY family inner membrane protein